MVGRLLQLFKALGGIDVTELPNVTEVSLLWEEITLEKLREQFQNNDFTQTALKSYSEYALEEVEFHNEIRSYVHES